MAERIRDWMLDTWHGRLLARPIMCVCVPAALIWLSLGMLIIAIPSGVKIGYGKPRQWRFQRDWNRRLQREEEEREAMREQWEQEAGDGE